MTAAGGAAWRAVKGMCGASWVCGTPRRAPGSLACCLAGEAPHCGRDSRCVTYCAERRIAPRIAARSDANESRNAGNAGASAGSLVTSAIVRRPRRPSP
jgi:hypothetical protein